MHAIADLDLGQRKKEATNFRQSQIRFYETAPVGTPAPAVAPETAAFAGAGDTLLVLPLKLSALSPSPDRFNRASFSRSLSSLFSAARALPSNQSSRPPVK